MKTASIEQILAEQPISAGPPPKESTTDGNKKGANILAALLIGFLVLLILWAGWYWYKLYKRNRMREGVMTAASVVRRML